MKLTEKDKEELKGRKLCLSCSHYGSNGFLNICYMRSGMSIGAMCLCDKFEMKPERDKV